MTMSTLAEAVATTATIPFVADTIAITIDEVATGMSTAAKACFIGSGSSYSLHSGLANDFESAASTCASCFESVVVAYSTI